MVSEPHSPHVSTREEESSSVTLERRYKSGVEYGYTPGRDAVVHWRETPREKHRLLPEKSDHVDN